MVPREKEKKRKEKKREKKRKQFNIHIPLWMVSASLSGISMLNSCSGVSIKLQPFEQRAGTNLLDGHNDLHGIKTVETKIVREVGDIGGLFV